MAVHLCRLDKELHEEGNRKVKVNYEVLTLLVLTASTVTKRYRVARINGITQFLPATHTTILTLLCKHSPDGTTQTRRRISDIAYYSIYRPRKDERLSWPSCLTCSGRLILISGHPSAAGRAWDRESSPVTDQRSNQCATQHTSLL